MNDNKVRNSKGYRVLSFDLNRLEDQHTLSDYDIQNESDLCVDYQLHNETIRRMFIVVETPSSGLIAIDVRPSDLIQQIREKIFLIIGIPPNMQRLTFAGGQLEDDHAVSFYKIVDKSVLHLKQRRLHKVPFPEIIVTKTTTGKVYALRLSSQIQ